jgi:cell division control protein 11
LKCFLDTYIQTNTKISDSSMNPEDLASQSVRLKEEQLRREEEKLREIEVKVQREINEKRQELLARESQLKEIEARMHREQSAQLEANGNGDRGDVDA